MKHEPVILVYDDGEPSETRELIVEENRYGLEFVRLKTRLGRHHRCPVYRVNGVAHAKIVGGKLRHFD